MDPIQSILFIPERPKELTMLHSLICARVGLIETINIPENMFSTLLGTIIKTRLRGAEDDIRLNSSQSGTQNVSAFTTRARPSSDSINRYNPENKQQGSNIRFLKVKSWKPIIKIYNEEIDTRSRSPYHTNQYWRDLSTNELMNQ